MYNCFRTRIGQTGIAFQGKEQWCAGGGTVAYFLAPHHTSDPLIGIILIADSYFRPIAAAYEKPFAWTCLRRMIRDGNNGRPTHQHKKRYLIAYENITLIRSSVCHPGFGRSSCHRSNPDQHNYGHQRSRADEQAYWHKSKNRARRRNRRN